MEIPEDSLTRTIKNGRQTIFQNDLHWARSHLYKAGLVSSPSYGQWGLTELGRHTHLTDEDARAIFNRVRDKSPEEVEAPDEESPAPEIEDLAELEETPEKASTYGLTDIIAEGCFLPELKLSNMLAHWRVKKNLILQGPPGTGKTWLAKRLGFALIGTDDYETLRTRMRVVQFHPSLSYEDFVRGFRPDCGPDGDGRLRLQEGVMMEAIKAAAGEPDRPFVLVIEEINRGNPAQILGEMLTLLESTKRKPSEAMELTYRKAPGERVYVPDNLHVIGTMNVADRSLALIDLALRRRFAFVDLEPAFGQSWRGWCGGRGIGAELLDIIETRIGALNETIAAAPSLGPQFRIGHSFLTPEETVADPSSWYCAMVKTEIGPLLDEHWYDAPEIARAERKKLLDGFPE